MKKCISIMLMTVMIMTALLGTSAVTFAAADKWDGTTAATAFAGGRGTKDDPYLISNAAQLVLLRNIVNATDGTYDSAYKNVYGERAVGSAVYEGSASVTHKRLSGVCFKLTNDLDMDGLNMDRGIGYSNDAANTVTFAGNFDGDGHIIKNLTLTPARPTFATALFGLTEDASIENLGIENAQITVNHNGDKFGHGVLIGKAYGTLNLDSCFVKNSKVNNSVTAINENVGLGILTGLIGTDAVVNTSDDSRYKINNCYAVNNEIAYTGTTAGSQKLKKVSVFGNTKGYGIDIHNCYAVNTESKKGLKITNIVDWKDSFRTDYIFACSADGNNAGDYTSKGSECFVVGKNQSTVFYLKANEAFKNVTEDELKALPNGLNSQNAYETKYSDTLNNGYPILKWEYERCYNRYKVSNLKYTANGSDVDGLQAGATLVSADFAKSAVASGDKTVIFAYYDKYGCLQTAKTAAFRDSDFSETGTLTLNVGMQLPSGDKFDGGKMQIFVWNDLDSLTPANGVITIR